MSIEKQYGVYRPICDICGEELSTEVTWQDAVDAKKAEGWKLERGQRGEWIDACPNCQK